LVEETEERDKECRNGWVYMWEMVEERCMMWGFVADAMIYNWHALNVMPNYMLGAVQLKISKHYRNLTEISLLIHNICFRKCHAIASFIITI
jgi:hypothetical protein